MALTFSQNGHAPERLERPVPYDVPAEEAVLGSLILDRDAIIKIAPSLAPLDFFREAHGWMYAAILDLYQRREPPDLVTLASELDRRQRLDLIGGMAYIAHLMNAAPTAVHVEYYAAIVKRAAILRRLISVGGQIAALGYEEGPEIAVTLNKAVGLLAQVAIQQQDRGFAPLAPVIDRRVEKILNRTAPARGIETGWPLLDSQTLGWHRGKYIVLAALTKVGKSTVALQWFRAACDALVWDRVTETHRPARVGYISIEMSKEGLADRLLAQETARMECPIALHRLREVVLNADEQDVLAAANVRLCGLTFFLLDAPRLNVAELPAYVQAAQAEHGLDIVFVDYLQLLDAESDTAQEQVRAASQGLRALARQADIPIIALAQLNRQAETAPVPTYAMIEGSGGPARDADLVFVLYRPDRADDRHAVLDLQLHRDGPPAAIMLEFDAATVRYIPQGGMRHG